MVIAGAANGQVATLNASHLNAGRMRQQAVAPAEVAHAGIVHNYLPNPQQFALQHGQADYQQPAYEPTMVASGIPEVTRQLRALASPSKGQPAPTESKVWHSFWC